jgi:preprotein translocase subunit SecE
MAIQEDVKRKRAEEDAPEQSAEALREDASSEEAQASPEEALVPDAEANREEEHEGEPAGPIGAASPTQLGTRRFVYVGYFAGAIAIAFLASKLLDFAWLRLQSWKPAVGEPRDEVVMPVSALIGGGAALYYWNRTRARELAEEVAAEMSKVTWPTRTEVTNGTFVVIVTTVVSTVFFALMDKFWGFVTNLVYGGS